MKKIKLVFYVVALVTLNFSCLVDDETGEDSLSAFSSSPNIVGFNGSNAALSFFTDIGTVRRDFPVEILGGQDNTPTTSDINISFEIDPASTAVLGNEFNFVNNTGDLLLPAGERFVNFPLDVITGNFDPDAPTTLIINLINTGNDSSVISANANVLTITFVGCQADLSGTFQVSNSLCGAPTNTQIIGNDDGSWSLEIGDGFFLAGCTTNATLLNPATINIICGEVQVASQPSFCSSNGIGCITGGTWDSASGVLTMMHTDTFFNGGPFEWTSTYTRL
ncbi:hypothetical protein [Lacinutrix sp.]|uniref:hypothetical protein n=1 Tax=Lacinutrix sp. TaxID=1937692 RepID=UPI0025BECB54|nr:hypothetical protein [Lacinutrix sp.]